MYGMVPFPSFQREPMIEYLRLRSTVPLALLALLSPCGRFCAPLQAADVIPATAGPSGPSGALAAYVAQPDDSYRWVKRRSGPLAGGEYAELILTSQTWHGIAWKHQLFVYKPAKIREGAQQGMLWIEGG